MEQLDREVPKEPSRMMPNKYKFLTTHLEKAIRELLKAIDELSKEEELRDAYEEISSKSIARVEIAAQTVREALEGGN